MNKKVRPNRSKQAKNPEMSWINIAPQRSDQHTGHGINNRLNDQNWQEIFTKNTDNSCQKQKIAGHTLGLRKDLKKRVVQKSLASGNVFPVHCRIFKKHGIGAEIADGKVYQPNDQCHKKNNYE